MGADFYMEDHEEDHNRVERVEKLITTWNKFKAGGSDHISIEYKQGLEDAHKDCAHDLKEALKASWEEDEEDE